MVIWTTTAWTIPANQALNAHPELDYALVDTPRGVLLLGASLVDKCLERFQLEGTVIATAKGEALRGLVFRHPLYDVDATQNEFGYKRLAPLYLADYVSDSDGTGIVHSSPAYGVDDFNSCVAHGLAYTDILKFGMQNKLTDCFFVSRANDIDVTGLSCDQPAKLIANSF